MGPPIGIAFGHPPLPRLLDVSPYSPTSIDIPMALACCSPPVGPPFFSTFELLGLRCTFHLFVVGRQTTHTKSGRCFTVSLWSRGFFVLFFEVSLFRFSLVSFPIAFCFRHIYHAQPMHDLHHYNSPTRHPSATTSRSLSSSSCTQPPPNHRKSLIHDHATNTSFHNPIHPDRKSVV